MFFAKKCVITCLLFGFIFVNFANVSNASPKNEILFIFNHGSSNHSGFDCYFWPFNRRPAWLREINGQTIDGKKVRVETPCTGFEKGEPPDERGCNEVWVCNRAIKIARKIKKYRDDGYPAQNIFVGGHSAGGWASLLIKRWKPNLFNGVIAVAPNFNGNRNRRVCKHKNCIGEDARKWNVHYRAQHNDHLGYGQAATDRLRALIITFTCDSHARPKDLSLGNVSYPPGINSDPKCANPSSGRRYYMGTDTTRPRCNDAPDLLGETSAQSPMCGSDMKRGPASKTYAMILNCPAGQEHYCDRDQHSKAQRSDDFRDYVISTGLVADFIRKQLKNRTKPPAPFPGKTPCGFMVFPDECPRYKY